jgi:formylmethanofuran dehydrogenase subunit B
LFFFDDYEHEIIFCRGGSEIPSFTLITGRTLDQGRMIEKGKFEKEYMEKVALCEMNPEDLKKLNITNSENIKVKTIHDEIVVKVVESPSSSQGIIFIPMGPWANAIVDPNTHGSGMPTLKGITVEVEPTSEEVLPLTEFLQKNFNKVAEIVPFSHDTTHPGEYLVQDAICPFCGCLCDDIEVKVQDSMIKSVRNPCAIGTTKFLNYANERIFKPVLKRNGKFEETTIDDALEKTANILVNAKYPILYGWSSTSNESIRLGVELAELVGGVMDNTTVTCHGPSIQGIQQTGTITSTLGQIRNRADLIVYWGCNPLHSHPRHTARYTAMAKGRWIKDRKSRKIIVVDVRPSATSKLSDFFVRVTPGMDYELLSALRMTLKEHTIEVPSVAGVEREKINEIADMLMSAKYGVLFFGMGVTMTSGKGRNIEEAIKLVQDLNEYTKFTLLAMRGHFNVAGACNVMTWTTGFPFAVEFSRGFPRHNPGITSTPDILYRKESDAALIIASDPISHFPKKAAEHLTKIPTSVIDARWTPTSALADVFIPSSYIGIESEGTVYRMDGVPLRAKKIVDPPPGILNDEQILEKLIDLVKEKIKRS